MSVSKELILQEAENIGNQVIASSITTKQGVTWKTLAKNKTELIEKQSFDIYSGDSGIALFLLELYKVTGKETYLEFAVLAASNMIQPERYRQRPIFHWGFFIGEFGIIYTILKIYDETKSQALLSYLYDIVSWFEQGIDQVKDVDVMTGASGIILGMLHLYERIDDVRLPVLMNKLIDKTLTQARVTHKAVYWQNEHLNIAPLCGISHGNSGIGMAFFELQNFFKKPCFGAIASHAFNYESECFNQDVNNWPDYRTGITDAQEFERRTTDFLNDKTQNLTTPSYSQVGWCNGATGIGLTRLRALEICPHGRYRREIDTSVAFLKSKILQVDIEKHSFSMCHGFGGVGTYLIAANSKLNIACTSEIDFLIENALTQKDKLGFYRSGISINTNRIDFSLMNGISGIGYFYLKSIKFDNQEDSFLNPFINITKKHKLPGRSKSQDKISILSCDFKQTTRLLNEIPLASGKKDSFDSSFIKYLFNKINDKSLPLQIQEKLRDAFDFEGAKLDFFNTIKNKAVFQITENLADKKTKLRLSTDNNLSLAHLSLRQSTKLIETKWDWTANSIAEQKEPSQTYLLLKLTGTKVQEIKLNNFSYLILKQFKGRMQVSKALEITIKYGSDNIAIYQQKALTVIRNALLAGLLEYDES